MGQELFGAWLYSLQLLQKTTTRPETPAVSLDWLYTGLRVSPRQYWVSKPTLARFLKGMVSSGHVSRCTLPGHGRAFYYSITPQGSAYCKEQTEADLKNAVRMAEFDAYMAARSAQRVREANLAMGALK